jgi:CubicO group peptidase (beta-lactamase class C family)
VLKDPPEVTPGNYLYSNQGYTVAASMMEIVTGKSWETLIYQEVLTPIRMSSATLGQVFDSALPPKAPVGHDLAAGQTVAVPRAPMDAATHYRYQASNAAGGFVACTLLDWTKFLHVQVTSDLSDYLTPATATRLQKPYTGAEGYSRGIEAVNRSWATPGQALTHAGDIFGQDTVVWMAPAKDLIIVVFTNCRSADNSTSLALDDVAGLLVTRYSGSVASGPLIELPSGLPPRRVGNDVEFDFLTLPGVPYLAETSPDLKTWTPSGNVAGRAAKSLQSFYLDQNPGLKKFYRARVGQ